MKVEALDNQRSVKTNTYPVDNFLWYIVASRGSGKSTLVINALLKIYLKQFNKIYWISPTSKLDQKTQILQQTEILTPNKPLIKLMNKLIKEQKKQILTDPQLSNQIISVDDIELNLTDENFIEELTEDFMEEIIDGQKAIIEEYGKKYADRILMVLDDSIDSKIITSKAFKDLVLKGRHYNISNIIISQSYRLLPKYIRTNCNFISIFETGNKKEADILYDETHNNLTKERWMELYQYCTNIPYGFMSLNYNNPKGSRFIQNLDKIINIDN